MSELTELGLSSYEERAYRAMLSLGSATASEIAERASVPTGRIYDVLNGLAARGLVETRVGTEPTVYEPIDPETAVDRLLEERTRELDRREAELRQAARSVRSDLAPTVPAGATLWRTDLGSEDALALWREQAKTATDRYRMAVGPPYDAADWATYAAELSPADRIGSDVSVRVLLSDSVFHHLPDGEIGTVIDGLSDIAVRVASAVRLSVYVVDDVECCLDLPDPFDPAERLGVALSREDMFVDEAIERFDRAWAAATSIGDERSGHN
ncbi:TrmB family transcriptional regulator [Halovivax limisalsi]|uniref:TrmB family transcriptional regulator n=1 Tax=Halovivax limisalsi TaxID=1453760 RepID=UPI001FFD25DA|nr:helix-turn-helix domain-containing protein [Halovivax limisalsi]